MLRSMPCVTSCFSEGDALNRWECSGFKRNSPPGGRGISRSFCEACVSADASPRQAGLTNEIRFCESDDIAEFAATSHRFFETQAWQAIY